MDKLLNYKQARAVANIDQRTMAKKLGISLPTLSAYENYRRNPPVDIYKLMCDYCGTEIDWKKPKNKK